MSKLADFTNTDVIDFAREKVAGDAQAKEDMLKILKDNAMDGKEMIETVKSANDLQDLKIAALYARRLFNELKKAFPNEFANEFASERGKAEAQSSNASDAVTAMLNKNNKKLDEQDRKYKNGQNGQNGINKKGEFKVSISVGGGQRKFTKNSFTVHSSVKSLKEEIASNEAGGNAEDVRLVFNTKPLPDDKTLGECGIVDNTCFVTCIIRLGGGAQASNDEKEGIMDNGKNSQNRERIADFRKNQNIKPTLEPCCLTFDDSKDELRVKMPCGHVFSTYSIYQWTRRTLEIYSKAAVNCPIEKCGKEWNVEDIKCGANLDNDEYGSLVSILNHRKLVQCCDFKECPYCKKLVELPETVYLCRVKCPSKECKNKADFCWQCNNPWKGCGMSVCGNKDCNTAALNDLLKIENCGTTTDVMSRGDVACPKLRACPRCLSITEFKKACKHMVCWNCKRSFCFICLSLAGKEVNGYGQNWACEGGDSHYGKCKLAPVQQIN